MLVPKKKDRESVLNLTLNYNGLRSKFKQLFVSLFSKILVMSFSLWSFWKSSQQLIHQDHITPVKYLHWLLLYKSLSSLEPKYILALIDRGWLEDLWLVSTFFIFKAKLKVHLFSDAFYSILGQFYIFSYFILIVFSWLSFIFHFVCNLILFCHEVVVWVSMYYVKHFIIHVCALILR